MADQTPAPHPITERLEQLGKLKEEALHAGSEASVRRQHERGKLTARERIELLLDPDTFGCEVEHREVVERDGVEEALLKVADSYIQLLTPSRPDSTVATYLDTKGEGIHHVGYRVDDCAAALAAVKANGHRVIDEQPRPGSRGTTVAFVHPKTAFGTLIELVQE